MIRKARRLTSSRAIDKKIQMLLAMYITQSIYCYTCCRDLEVISDSTTLPAEVPEVTEVNLDKTDPSSSPEVGESKNDVTGMSNGKQGETETNEIHQDKTEDEKVLDELSKEDGNNGGHDEDNPMSHVTTDDKHDKNSSIVGNPLSLNDVINIVENPATHTTTDQDKNEIENPSSDLNGLSKAGNPPYDVTGEHVVGEVVYPSKAGNPSDDVTDDQVVGGEVYASAGDVGRDVWSSQLVTLLSEIFIRQRDLSHDINELITQWIRRPLCVAEGKQCGGQTKTGCCRNLRCGEDNTCTSDCVQEGELCTFKWNCCDDMKCSRASKRSLWFEYTCMK